MSCDLRNLLICIQILIVGIIVFCFEEEKVDRIKLKEENADLQRQLMNAEREAQRMEDKKTMVESKLQQKEQDVEVLKEKMESMVTSVTIFLYHRELLKVFISFFINYVNYFLWRNMKMEEFFEHYCIL